MKQFSILLLVSILFINCKPKEKTTDIPNTFTLNADLDGLDEEFLIYWEKNEKYPDGIRQDTLWVENGKFTFTDSVTDYKTYFLNVTNPRTWTRVYDGKEYTASTKADVNRLWFIGYPGATITCTGKVNGYRVDAQLSDEKGVNNDLAAINLQTFPLYDEAHGLSVSLSIEDWTGKDAEAMKVGDSVKALRLKAADLKKEFIKTHPKSIAASYVFSDAYYRKYFSHEEAMGFFKNFDSTALSGTPFYDEVKKRLESVDKTRVGMQAPDLITSNTLDGKEFKLSALKGNYVLFDYWGTWCGPCMAEMPKIKEYYNKYKDRNFVVVGVNSGDTASRWQKAVEENNYIWTHIQTTKDNNLLIPFNVNSFPTKILLDPEGKIIYSSKNTDLKVDLYQMIDGIFTKS